MFLAPPAVEQTQFTQVISRIHTEQTIQTTTEYPLGQLMFFSSTVS